MSAVEKDVENLILSKPEKRSVIIIGAGPVGMRVLSSLIEHGEFESIRIFGDEPWQPYNRVKLSSFLAGDIDLEDLIVESPASLHADVAQYHHCAIVEIDRLAQCVIDEFGQSYRYTHLILATGSRPHIPNIDGVRKLERIYTFRDLTDANHLLARRVTSRSTVIVGGGLLGLEAARAMTRQNTKVTVIDHSSRLMSQQLDEGASEYLREHIMTLGIRVFLGSGVKAILGETKVSGVKLLNGKEIECDTVIFATGIIPNIELARNARLSVGRGIRVNNSMQTTDEHIYAVGECAQHLEKVYGIVSPGYEQAEVAAHHIAGKKVHYTGSICATRLKVVGISIFSMGKVGEEEFRPFYTEYVYRNKSKNIFKKIVLSRGRLIGAIAVGGFSAEGRVQEAITKCRRVWPWQVANFLKTGEIWGDGSTENVHQWPAGTLVCHCMQVSRGECSKAIANGCATVEEVMQATNASTVCGSCRPLLAQLLGAKPRLERLRAVKTFFLFSFVSAILALAAYFLPSVSYSTSSLSEFSIDVLWRDNTLKQITGFSILGIALLALLLSVRKRWRKFRILQFSAWRYMHVVLGLLAIVAIFAHTGFRLGENLNYWLMMPFVAVILIGAITSLFMSFQHKLDAGIATNVRKTLIWGHILTFWPIPAVLGMHIMKSYYF